MLMHNLDRQKYNYGLALLKIIMCFEVVVCHFGNGNADDSLNIILIKPFLLIQNCAVPCFFIMAFYFSASLILSGEKNKLKKRIKRILIPHIFWTVIYFLIYFMAGIMFDFDYFDGMGYIKSFGLQLFFGHTYNQTMWFQIDLLIVTIFLFLLFKQLYKKYNDILIWEYFLLIAFLLLQYTLVNYRMFSWMSYAVRYTFGRISEVIPLAVAGLLLSVNQKWIEVRKNKLGFVFCMVVVGISLFITKLDNHFLNFGYAGIGLLLAGIFFVIAFYGIDFTNIPQRLKIIIEFFSSYTMGIYFVHRMVGTIMLSFNLIGDSPLMNCTMIFVISLLISILIHGIPLRICKESVS
ncbi:MAG: acyltransferase family protein [Lachnospiraceae bacterium]